jgi:adenylate cyclase
VDSLSSTNIILFDGFRLDRRRGALFRRDERGVFAPIVLGSRSLEILGVLVERPGDLVSRAEIMDAVWPETAVDDSNLNVQIAALRRVLDQGRTDGSCIQTVPGRGYRFTGALTRVGSEARFNDATVSPSAAPPLRDEPSLAVMPLQDMSGDSEREYLDHGKAPRRRLSAIAAITAATSAVLIVTVVGWWVWPATRSSPTPAAVGTAAMSISQAAVAPRLSIVVLPFANLSDDREQQYFADGVNEDLTTDLSRIGGSFVISRNTAFSYKDKPVNAKQIGRELGVRYLLEGSVQRSAKQVRINAQLIDAESNAHLWAERFDRDINDLFALQNEITGRIAVALGSELVIAEAARPTEHPEALDYIFRGRAAMNKPPARDNYAEAIGLFEHALTLDPRSVEAQSWLAIALARRVLDQMSDSTATDIARAQGLVGQALAALPGSPLAHFAKGDLLVAQRQFAEAIPEYETVLAANRNSVDALAIIGRQKINIGMIDEAIPFVEQAIRLSPRDPRWLGIWYLWIAQANLLRSRTDEAILWLEKARSANPAHPKVHLYLAAAYALKGETARAAAELAEARRLVGDDRFSSIARLHAADYLGVPNVRALFEATYFAGLRKAGVPEE